MQKEETLSIARKQLPHKAEVMFINSYNKGKYQINFDPGRTTNLWDEPTYADVRADMVRAVFFGRWGMEPPWMPQVAGA